MIPLDAQDRTSNAIYFYFFKFKLEFLIGVQSSDPIDTKISPKPPNFLGRLVVCAQTALFFNKPVSKKAELYSLCM
jgi:hypothetical protein